MGWGAGAGGRREEFTTETQSGASLVGLVLSGRSWLGLRFELCGGSGGGGGMREVVMRGGSSGSGEGMMGDMMGEGGERGVVRDRGMAIEGWRRGTVEGKVVEDDHTEHVQMSQRSSRHDG